MVKKLTLTVVLAQYNIYNINILVVTNNFLIVNSDKMSVGAKCQENWLFKFEIKY